MIKKHIFISYCHENIKEVTDLRGELLDAGETVWWDNDIIPGQDWKFEIKKAIKESYAILLCFSDISDEKYKSGIYPEIQDAITEYRNYQPGIIFIIPIRFSNCKIPMIEIDSTRMLDSLQYIDLFPDSKKNENLKIILKALRSCKYHP